MRVNPVSVSVPTDALAWPATSSATNGLPRGHSLTLPREDKALGEALSITTGVIANLDDPNFSAASGVKHLDFPVPAWHDMSPGSSYLKTILAEPPPPGTRHDLIFGFKTSGGLGMPNDNDGVVGVESEQVPEVQSAAASVFGLNLDHGEILRSPIVLEKLHQALAR